MCPHCLQIPEAEQHWNKTVELFGVSVSPCWTRLHCDVVVVQKELSLVLVDQAQTQSSGINYTVPLDLGFGRVVNRRQRPNPCWCSEELCPQLLCPESDHALAPMCQEVIMVDTASLFSWFFDTEPHSAERHCAPESPALGAHGCRGQGPAGKPSGNGQLFSAESAICHMR